MPTRRDRSSSTRLRPLARWGSTILAAAALALWTLTLFLWCGLSIGGYSCTLSHGALALERTDTSVGWTASDGGAFPEHVRPLGGVGTISWTHLGDLPGYLFASRFEFLRWRPAIGSTAMLLSRGQRWYIDVPLWMIFLPATILAAFAWRAHIRRQRAIRNHACPGCGYDLHGIDGAAPCPECGLTRPRAPAPGPAPP